VPSASCIEMSPQPSDPASAALARVSSKATSARAKEDVSRARRAVARWLSRARTVPRPLAALLAVATIQVVAWALVLPPFQGPDEDAHFAYAQYFAETGQAPGESTGNGRAISSEQEAAMDWAQLRSLRGVLGARPAWSAAEERRWQEVEASLPDAAGADGLGPNAVAQNPPLYYALEAIPYHLAPGGSFFNRFYVMRLASAVFYLAIVGLMWLIASELFRPLWARTLSTALVALQPKLAMLGAVVNPDILLALAWTAFIYAGVRILRRGPSRRRVLGAGAASAVALLTHGRGLAIVAALLALLVIAYLRWRPARREVIQTVALSVGPVAVALIALVVFTSDGPGSGGVYGGEVSRLGARGFNFREFLSYVWQFYLPKLTFMQPAIGPLDYGFREVYIKSFYGDFAWLEIEYPRFAIDLLAVATVALLLGVYTVAVRRLDAIRRSWPVIAFILLTAIALIGTLHVSSYRDLLLNPSDPLFTGRYLLPLVPILAIGVTSVATALPRTLAPLATGAVVATGVVLQLTALGMTFVRFYA
jgi:Predicted membrane protein (DUF2142)